MNTKPEYHVRQDDLERGPLTRGQVESLLFSRQIAPTAEIWMEGFGDWQPIASIFPDPSKPRSNVARTMAIIAGASAAVVAIPLVLLAGSGNIYIQAVAWVVAALAYFIPAAIAIRRNHRNALAISVLNVLLGWTLLGWIAALIWSCTDNAAPAK